MISPNLSSTTAPPFPALRPSSAETSPPPLPSHQQSSQSPPSSPTSNGETASGVSRMTNFSIAAIMNSSQAVRPPAVSVASLFAANPLTAAAASNPMTAAMTAAQRYQTALLTMQQNQAAAMAALSAAGLRRTSPQDTLSPGALPQPPPPPTDALVNSPYGKTDINQPFFRCSSAYHWP